MARKWSVKKWVIAKGAEKEAKREMLNQWILRQRYLLIVLITAILCVVAPPAIAHLPQANLATNLASGLTQTPPVPSNASIEAQGTTAQGTTAQGLMEQGRDRYQSGQFIQAIDLLQQAAAAYEAERQTMQQAIALSNLSLAHQSLGQWSEAQRTIENSLELLESTAADPTTKDLVTTQALTIQGRLQFAQGQFQSAFDTWKQTTDRYRRLQDQAKVIDSQFNQAQALQAMGFYKRAIAQLAEIRLTLTTEPASPTKVTTLYSLGNALRIAGYLDPIPPSDDDPDKDISREESLAATTVLTEALNIAQRLGLEEAIAKIHISLGDVERAKASRLSRPTYVKAETQYDLAIAHASTPTTQIDARLRKLNLLMQAKLAKIDWAEIQRLSIQIQDLLQSLPPTRTTVYQRVDLAQNLITLNQKIITRDETQQVFPEIIPWVDITSLLTVANQQAEELDDQKVQSYVLGTLGTVYEKAEQYTDAEALTRQSLRLAQTTNASDITYQWYWQLARLRQKADDANRDEVIDAYEQSLNSLEGLRTDLSGVDQEAQFSFRDQIEPLHREFVAFLLDNPENPSADDLEKARQTIEDLQLAELNDFFRESCLDAKDIKIEDIDPNAAVIYPIILGDRLDVIVSLPNQNQDSTATKATTSTATQATLRHHTVSFASPTSGVSQRPTNARGDIGRSIVSIKDQIQTVRASTVGSKIDGQNLYTWLIQPFEADFAANNIETLVFTLDGELRNIPMAVLFDGDKYLIEKYRIALTPGLQLLNSALGETKDISVLMGGLTEARNVELVSEKRVLPLNALKFVEPELNRIREVIPNNRVLLDESFTSNAVQSNVNASTSPVVHLATHGYFGSTPEDTFLLTWDDRININQLSTFLQSGELNRRQPIELLVLSACQTAKGDGRAALGLAGTAIKSGALSTIATLWNVDDQATSILMSNFYENWITGNLTKAEALRQAQLSLLHNPDYEKPFYWAPFILLGNWL